MCEVRKPKRFKFVDETYKTSKALTLPNIDFVQQHYHLNDDTILPRLDCVEGEYVDEMDEGGIQIDSKREEVEFEEIVSTDPSNQSQKDENIGNKEEEEIRLLEVAPKIRTPLDSLVEEMNASLLESNKGIKRNVIYMDIPWKYDNEKISGNAESHYKTLPFNVLKRLRIREIAADNCYIYMWTTFIKFTEACNLLAYWGFAYVTSPYQWIKTTRGAIKTNRLGLYTAQNTEFIILGRHGITKHLLDTNCLRQCSAYLIDSTVHSRKPLKFRELINERHLDLPRIELFARQNDDPDWDVWGNEIDMFGSHELSPEKVAEIRKTQIENARDCEAKRFGPKIDKLVNVVLNSQNQK